MAGEEVVDDIPEDERLEVDVSDDDETSTDPVDETGDTDAEVEGEDADGADETDEPLAADAAQPEPRGHRAFGALRAERRRLAEENARITRELDDLRRQRPVQPAVQEDPRAEADRLALMSPDERTQYTIDKALGRHQQQNQQLMAQLLDQSDRTAFDARQTSDPLAKKLGAEVERRLLDLRSKGQNLPRQTIYTYLLGERVLAQQGKKNPAAAQRAARQRAPARNSGGDVQQPRQARRNGADSVSSFEQKYGDQQI